MKNQLVNNAIRLILIALDAIITGSFVWWLWPKVVPSVFPGLIDAAILPAQLSWLVSVGLVMLLGVAFLPVFFFKNILNFRKLA